MRSTVDKIREEALSLSVSERASLAHDLILSLEKEDGLYFDEEYEGELKRRVLSVKEGKAEARDAGDVLSDIEKRYKK
jgi:putative addiction module component (TIGR02574 family)